MTGLPKARACPDGHRRVPLLDEVVDSGELLGDVDVLGSIRLAFVREIDVGGRLVVALASRHRVESLRIPGKVNSPTASEGGSPGRVVTRAEEGSDRGRLGWLSYETPIFEDGAPNLSEFGFSTTSRVWASERENRSRLPALHC